MSMPRPSKLRSLPPRLLAVGLLGLFDPSAIAAPAAPMVTTITISERAFSPDVLSLKRGEAVTLIIQNQDHDLHAFVPLLLFQGLNVMVTGNGAPEFNETGFARVLIPPRGQVEIRLKPPDPGHFFYICDLPGHQMRGEIIVTGDSL